ncbi:unnamed protein product [Prunus armeniaca]
MYLVQTSKIVETWLTNPQDLQPFPRIEVKLKLQRKVLLYTWRYWPSAYGFPLASNPVGNISSGQVLQHERFARFVDNECKYEEYGGKSDKITGKDERRESNRFSLINTQRYELSHLGKADEVCSKRKNIVDHSYGSFKGLTEDGRDSNEKIQDNALKSGLSQL